MRPKPFWTPAKIDLLKTAWTAGKTGNQCAKLIGCTRNMVLGKVNRLGLSIDKSDKVTLGKRIAAGLRAHWRDPEVREKRSANRRRRQGQRLAA